MSEKQKTKKPDVWWCIKNGELLLPYTARVSRRDCVADWKRAHPGCELGALNRLVKIKVSETQR